MDGLGSILLGLAAAVAFGISDYTGGIASRRYATFTVLVMSQFFGAVMFFALGVLTNDPLPTFEQSLALAFAGVIGAVGINLFLYGLAVSKMSMIAPASAAVTAAVPILFTLSTQGLPEALTVAGFIVALVAVWLIASGGSLSGLDWQALWIPLAVGGITGIVFTIISQATTTSTFYALVVLRLTSMAANLAFATIRKQPYFVRKPDLPLIAVTGILNGGGVILFTLAVQGGRLDVTAVLINMAPAVTVFMAALLLRERLNRLQGVGVALALLAIVFISV